MSRDPVVIATTIMMSPPTADGVAFFEHRFNRRNPHSIRDVGLNVDWANLGTFSGRSRMLITPADAMDHPRIPE